MKVLAGNASRDLATNICKYLKLPLGKAMIGRYPDGEIEVRIDEDVRGREIFLVQSTCPPVNENLMELLILMDCARRASAERITAVIPYYGYARKDRKDEGRVPITAKLVANLLTSAGADRVLTIDLHATQIQGFFDIPVDHLFAFPVLYPYFRALEIPDLTVVAPDVGSIKLARAYAKWLGGSLAVVDKRRKSPEEAEVGFLIGDVEGRNVLMMDDMITTGGSIVQAALTLKEHGARDIYVGVTHPVLCGPAEERLLSAPIKEIVATDTVPVDSRAERLRERLKVLSVANLLGEAMRRIHDNKSVSSLFAKFS